MDILAAPEWLFWFIIGKVIPFVFVLTIVVFFHELGHFLVARWNKVKVDAFAVGFGPEIIGRNDRHGTRWKLCVIPLGGYVKFLGDEDASSKPDRDALDAMDASEREGAFEHKALWRKAAVVAAGPIANFILASVIYTALFVYYGDARISPVVGTVGEVSAAKDAGILVGDKIVSINGDAIDDFQDISRYTLTGADTPLLFVIQRGNERLTIPATPRMTEREDRFGNKFMTGLVGIGPDTSPENIVRIQLGVGAAFTKTPWDWANDLSGRHIGHYSTYFTRRSFICKHWFDESASCSRFGRRASHFLCN